LPLTNLFFSFGDYYVRANFSENRSRNATVRVLVDAQTDRQTQTDFITCPMRYAIAMGQIIKKTRTVWKSYRQKDEEMRDSCCDEGMS